MGFFDNLIDNISDVFDPDKIDEIIDSNLSKVETVLDGGLSKAEEGIDKATGAIDKVSARIDDTIK